MWLSALRSTDRNGNRGQGSLRMGLLILLLGLFQDGSGQDGTGNTHRRRCGTTDDRCDGKDRKEFSHRCETYGEDDNTPLSRISLSVT